MPSRRSSAWRPRSAGVSRESPGACGGAFSFSAVALVLPVAAYAGAARWLLSGPRLRALINADPESLLLDYDEATSFWPGRVTIRNLRIRGSDQNVQWIIRLATARVDYSILALAQRTFRVEHLRGDGLSFFLRNKLEPAARADRGCLRPSAGSGLRRSAAAVGPASRAPSSKATPGASTSAGSSSTTSTTSGSTPFTTAASPAWREGSFCARGCSPASDPRACASRAAGCASEMRRMRSPSSAPCRERSSRSSRPSSTEARSGRRSRATSRSTPGSSGSPPSSTSRVRPPGPAWPTAPGAEPFAAPSSTGSRRETSGSASRTGTVGLRELTLHGNADLRLRIPRWNLVSGPLEISGSRLALSDVRSSGPDAVTDVVGPIRRAFRRDRQDGVGGHRGRRPGTRAHCSRSFRRELPAWTRGLVDLDDFTATATRRDGPFADAGARPRRPGRQLSRPGTLRPRATPIARAPS